MYTAPTFDAFDPLTPEQRRDPYAVLSRARREAPVFYMPKYGMYCVTRYEDAVAVLKDEQLFSTSGSDATVVPMPQEIRQVLPHGHPVSNSLHCMESATHSRVRRLTQKAFGVRGARAWQGVVERTANELIDFFPPIGEIDLVKAFSSHIPARVIVAVLGLPVEDASTLQRWTDEFFILSGNAELPAPEAARLWQHAAEFRAYLRDHVAHRRVDPGDDLTTELIQAESEDGSPSLTDEEIVNVVAGIIAAGSDTTTVLIAEAVRLMLQSKHPWWEEARHDPWLIGKIVDEAVRMLNPVRGLRRTALEDAVVGGVQIPKDAILYIQLGSVNRDEKVFDRPNVFDPRRADLRKHVGLGVGVRYCLGANLARVEAQVSLECLIRRLPMPTMVRDQDLEYSATTYVPALSGLRVRVGEQ